MESPRSAVATFASFSAVSLEDLLHQISSESVAHVRLRENTVLDRLLAECKRQMRDLRRRNHGSTSAVSPAEHGRPSSLVCR